jgi:hypothetical protein
LDGNGTWHVVFEDCEEDVLQIGEECKVVSVKEAAPADAVCLGHGMLRIKRDMLDMCAAMATQDTLWWARRRQVWEADVRNARSVAQLNELLYEFGRSSKPDYLERWWSPWEGWEVRQANATQIVSRRCRYTEGGKSWRCKSAAIPGRSVCKRHMKKQLASAGVAGFEILLRPSDNPDAQGLKHVEEGMNVEVYYPKDGEWYQARVLTVNKRGQSKVAYINAEDQGEVTEQSQTELVTDRRRLRLPENTDGGEKGEAGANEEAKEEGEDDEDDAGDEENGLIMPNEEAVTVSAVLLRIHSLDQAIRYADEVIHDKPPAPKKSQPKRKKKQ